MELTRRDAAAALAAVGATGGVALAARRSGDGSARGGADRDEGTVGEAEDGEGGDALPDEATVRASMTAAAAVVYPETVDGVEAFVDAFLDGRLDGSAHATGLRVAVGELEEAARSWYGAPVAELRESDRDGLLREVGADTADEDPDGTLAERVRYYVVNELLLALYASPTGGELVGLENPEGHPGGTESYRRGPR
ncbi:gluconate 2-dehydrogenase subunit 3 family protein [Halorubrum amylolyticum]|uniref:gluconate 2-dehydrogenase subunit 3 family protein n=1 Tax=Halorubrum amylolyticum TaxID=2508724 RepID=UPI00100924A8|nr:gluconate 2-dehydrogenase subunit 3 family protein [Halorubrum amylolyticum]